MSLRGRQRLARGRKAFSDSGWQARINLLRSVRVELEGRWVRWRGTSGEGGGARGEKLEGRNSKLETQKQEVKSRKSKAGSQKQEVKSRKSKAGSQKQEVKSRKSKAGSQKQEVK